MRVLGLFLILFCTTTQAQEFHSLSFKSLKGKTVQMSEFKGKNVLIVNTASKCGYTGQYDGLQKLHEEIGKNKADAAIIGFPSASFKQELSSDGKVADFCKINYGVKFPLSKITPVKGKNRHPVYSYLVENSKKKPNQEVSWNFEKFVVDGKGEVVGRFSSNVPPSDPKIRSLLGLPTLKN